MKGIFGSKVTLILTYIAMAAICVYLNLTSDTLSKSNMIVSGAMFLIVLVIFIYSFARFHAIDVMVRDLEEATDNIKSDFSAKRQYLWESYRKNETLFKSKKLRKRYADFTAEIERLDQLSEGVYKCDIEDYINQDLVDTTMNRGVMNMVAGTMTGLGILGTFIGLTIGLQAFNTGNADAITQSIAPLIEGIKVAFHTSIYGMVFSLIFSFVYKNKMSEADKALDEFLDAYDNFVIPDSQNDNLSQMLSYQKKQAEGMNELADSIGNRFGAKLTEVMNTQLNRMNDTVTNFAYVASKSQVEGVDAIVNKFIQEMDASLGNQLTQMAASMVEMINWEKENREYMRSLLTEIGTMGTDLSSISNMTGRTVEGMAAYVGKLDDMQGNLNDEFTRMQEHMASNAAVLERQQNYIEALVEYEKQLSTSSDQFSRKMAEQLAFLQRMETKISEIAKQNIEDVTATAQQASRQMSVTADTAGAAMQQSADNLAQVSEDLGKQLSTSLKKTYDTVNKMQGELESLIYAMDVLRRNSSARNQLK